MFPWSMNTPVTDDLLTHDFVSFIFYLLFNFITSSISFLSSVGIQIETAVLQIVVSITLQMHRENPIL